MKGLLAAAACLLAVQVAEAAPQKEALAERVAALEKKLAGQGYTIMIEGPFVVIGDESTKRVQQRANFMSWVLRLIEQDFFKKQPDKVIEVWLFRNERTYRKGAKKFFGDTPETPFGYYSSDDDALIMNIGPGAGTLSHELVHPYMEATSRTARRGSTRASPRSTSSRARRPGTCGARRTGGSPGCRG